MRARHGVGARRRSGTWPFRSAPCLLIRKVVSAQLCAHPPRHSCGARRPVDMWTTQALCPHTHRIKKQQKVSVNLVALEAQQSDPVRHNPDRQPGQPRHSSPYSVSILAAIHTPRRQLPPTQGGSRRSRGEYGRRRPQFPDAASNVDRGCAQAGRPGPDHGKARDMPAVGFRAARCWSSPQAPSPRMLPPQQALALLAIA
jgi:hypothetical protein